MQEDSLVETEQRFKHANEGLRKAVQVSVSSEQRIPFLCECADDDCLGQVELTLAEYTRIRGNHHRFVTLPGHELGRAAKLVEEHQRFQVMEK